MSVVEFEAPADIKKRGLNVVKGQTLYAVKKKSLFFIWAYVDKEFAHKMDDKLEWPNDAVDRGTNWRYDVYSCSVSNRTEFN